MRAYRSKRFLYSQIKDKIIDARYLLDVGLPEQAESCLDEAKAMAETAGDTLSLLEINREYRKLLRRTFIQSREQKLLKHTEAQGQLEVQLQEEFWAVNLSDRVVVETNRVMRSENRADNERLRQEFADLLDESHTPRSIRAQLACYQIRVVLLHYLGEMSQAYAEGKKSMNLWAQYPDLQTEEPFAFINDLANHLTLAIQQKDYPSATTLQQRLENYQPQSVHEEAWWFRKCLGSDLLLCVNTANIDKLEQIEKKIEQGIQRFDIAISGQFHFYINLAILQFMAGAYQKCLQSCEHLVKQHQVKDRQDARVLAGLLRVMAMYELEHPDFENALRASDRLLEKAEISFLEDFEEKILNYLRALNRAPERERRSIWQKMQEYLVDSNNSLLEIAILLRAWVSQHLHKESMVEWIKRERK
jgi:hypothetical protein